MHSSGDTVDDDVFDVLSKSKENMVLMMLMVTIFGSWIYIPIPKKIWRVKRRIDERAWSSAYHMLAGLVAGQY